MIIISSMYTITRISRTEKVISLIRMYIKKSVKFLMLWTLLSEDLKNENEYIISSEHI